MSSQLFIEANLPLQDAHSKLEQNDLYLKYCRHATPEIRTRQECFTRRTHLSTECPATEKPNISY